jgi:hypothetical protein
MVMKMRAPTLPTFTAVVPTRGLLPHDLAILLAPVRAAEPSAPDEYVGRADGVLLDFGGRVVAFVVRLAKKLDAHGARTLVPVTALTLEEGPMLHLSWTEDQLRAQPRLDQGLQPHNQVDGGPPVESQWMPALPNVVPPGSGVNGTEAAKESLEGGFVGAAIGALAGLAIGGPVLAASLAVFFAAGGSLAGLLSGASQETAAEAGEMKFAPLETDDRGALGLRLQRLEERLGDPGLEAAGLVNATRLTLATTTEASPSPSRKAAPGAATAQAPAIRS